MTDNKFEAPKKKAIIKNPELCISWEDEKCTHKAHRKGADCSYDTQCLLWKECTIPKCIDCTGKIAGEKFFDKDGLGPYDSLCYERLPEEFKSDVILN